MSTSIAIIGTLDELTAYSIADPQNRYFSLNLSVGFRGDPDLPAGPVAVIFQPWQFKAITLSVYADEGDKGGVLKNGVPITPDTSITPATVKISNIAKRLEARFAAHSTDKDYFHWSDEPGTNQSAAGESWPRVLAHASTYTPTVPHNLNLSYVFKVPVGQLSGKKRLFAAPTLTFQDGTTYKPNTTPETPSAAGIAEWRFPTAPAGYTMSAVQPEYMLSDPPNPLPALHFIDPYSGWIATSDGTDQIAPDESLVSEDWRATLDRRAGEEFDLAQRMLVVLRSTDLSALTFLQVDLIRDAILAALRDTADFGLRFGPDGTNLVRFACVRAGVDPAPIEVALTKIEAQGNGPKIDDWTGFLSSQKILRSIPRDGASDGQLATVAYVRNTLDSLESMQTTLAKDGTLATLLYAQWDSYLAANADWTKAKLAVQSTLLSLADSRSLRARMLLANLGGVDKSVAIWKVLTSTTGTTYAAETADIIKNFQALLAAYFRGRFGITVADPNSALFVGRAPAASWPGGAATPTPDLSSGLRGDAKSFADKTLFKPNQATPASHPIIIQIGDTTDAAGLALTDDIERKISGVGLLIREETGPWTCANMANVVVAGETIAANRPVPIRLRTKNKLKQPVLSYNNNSLIAQDAADPRTTDFPHGGRVVPTDPNADWDQLFQFQLNPPAGNLQFDTDASENFKLTIPDYIPPTDDLAGWSRSPALKVNRTYQLLPFFFGNNGALPPLLASTTDVFTPVKPSVFAAAWTYANKKGFLRTVKYLRRVQVGAPRLKPKDAAGTLQDNFPQFPSTVVPIARDFLQKTQGTSPILLLWNAGQHSNFAFQLRPPACDPETWDRWVAGLGDNYRTTRIAVGTGVNLLSPKDTNAANLPDISLDDPAVKSIVLSFTREYPPAAAGPINQEWVVPALTPLTSPIMGNLNDLATALLSHAQSTGFTVACSMGPASSNPVFSLTGNKLTITVPAGEVWHFTAKPTINLSANFEPYAQTITAFDVLIETAVEGSFDPTIIPATFALNLWTNLKPHFDGANLTVSLDPTSLGPDGALIRNVDLRRQAWRWMGRPIAPMPASWANFVATNDPTIDDDPALVPGPNSRLWELGSFAERPDEDSLTSQTAINYALPAPQVPALYSADLSNDLRAQYHRFGIEAHSRYEGLDGFRLTTVRAQKNVAASTGYTRWKRQIIPHRVTGEPPKPKILLAIPLTAPDSTGTSTLPDLLVIANEPWFKLGGLCEELHAQFDLARDPAVLLSAATIDANPIPEIGPNQILTTSRMDEKLFTPPGGGVAAPAEPIGTTFDLNTSAPLFGNTCFRVKSSMLESLAPNAKGVLPADGLQHFEAKIRFTRVINGANIGKPQNRLESKRTDPFWVEFQPSFEHCYVKESSSPIRVNDLDFSISNNKITFKHGNTAVTPIPGPIKSSQLELWALIMKIIRDVSGREQTFAVDLIGPDFSTKINDSSDLIVFLVEVLCAPGVEGTFKGTDASGSGISNAKNLLFPDSTSADPNSKARISRSSPQINHR